VDASGRHDAMDQDEHLRTVADHCRRFFDGHACSEWTWDLGPIKELAPFFKVLRFTPGPLSPMWTSISLGASLLGRPNSTRLEFVLETQFETPRSIELLAMVAHYHHMEHLGLHHTLPIGEPWQKDASCDHFLVSLPYAFGPKLEVCCLSGESHVQLLSLMPITNAELEFKKEHGVEALEQKFDEHAISYADPRRASVV
jgi:hypothetical protein